MGLEPTSNGTGDSIQTTVLNAPVRTGGAAAITVAQGNTITFDADASGVYINQGTSADASDYFNMLGGDVFTIPSGVTSIYVTADVGYVIT